MKPTQIVIESDCETCQCLNNEYICVTSNHCKTPEIALPNSTVCNPDLAIIEHTYDCSKYLVCTYNDEGEEYYKTEECSPLDFFNPKTSKCEVFSNILV